MINKNVLAKLKEKDVITLQELKDVTGYTTKTIFSAITELRQIGWTITGYMENNEYKYQCRLTTTSGGIVGQ